MSPRRRKTLFYDVGTIREKFGVTEAQLDEAVAQGKLEEFQKIGCKRYKAYEIRKVFGQPKESEQPPLESPASHEIEEIKSREIDMDFDDF